MPLKEKYEAHSQESAIKEFWLQRKIYSFDKNSSKPTFSIDTPPPTVSGSLHIGHIFSYLHADFVARYKRMTGHNVYYPMGFDDNGLPTEKFVEKQRKIRSKLLKRSDFIKICLEECKIAEESFKNLWQSIGLSIDWNYCYSTISDLARRVSQRSFLNLYKKGLIYRKKEPSLFCTDFQTTVAQAELDIATKESSFNTLIFKSESGENILIATTRPELLAAVVCVFIHPEDHRAKDLVGKKLQVPIFNHWVPILEDTAVLKDKGTGIVMCSTFGDNQDVLWFKKHNLPLIEAIKPDGRMSQVAQRFEGMKILEARAAVIDALKENNLLVEQKPIVHDVHIYERSKKEIEYIVSSQWFIKILDFKEMFLQAGEQIFWTPPFMKSRYNDWVKNLTWDWCISRQRHFGVPFPAWHCNDCQAILLADESMLPVDPQEQAYPKGVCDHCGKSNISPDTDVMDTWATSGSTPQINAEMLGLKPNIFLPMSIRPQAHDIIRTWAFDTIVKSMHEENKLPWNEILISGHVLAGGKEKISKSAGNSQITPQSLLENFSADAIRFWAAKGKLGLDTAFSVDQLKNGNRLVTKLWNATKFCHDAFSAFKSTATTVPDSLDVLSKWILAKLGKTIKTYHQHFIKHEYTAALDSLDQFFWHTFCDNYLEIVKDQVWNPDKYDADAPKIYAYVLRTCCLEILKMYSPFIPFVTEKLYQAVFAAQEEKASIHLSQFDSEHLISSFIFPTEEEDFETIIACVAAVRKLKSENSLSLKTEIQQLFIHCDKPQIIQKDLTATNLLIGATKALKIIIHHEKFEQNILVQEEHGFIAKINL